MKTRLIWILSLALTAMTLCYADEDGDREGQPGTQAEAIDAGDKQPDAEEDAGDKQPDAEEDAGDRQPDAEEDAGDKQPDAEEDKDGWTLEESDRPKWASVRFVGVVTDVDKTTKLDLTKGIVVGSRFRTQLAVKIRIERIQNDPLKVLTPDQVIPFYVRNLGVVFPATDMPRAKTPESKRRYRFLLKGERVAGKYQYPVFTGSPVH